MSLSNIRMQPSINTKIESILHDIIFRHFKDPTINIFDSYIEKCQQSYNQPCTTITQLKQKSNTKVKGDLFEHFCLKYLQVCYGLPEVWLLKDLPSSERTKLSIPSSDCGIDIIGKSQDRYYAIQAKFRKPSAYQAKKCIGWKDLSTFFALVSRSGPWHKQIVMTNADWVRRVGTKSDKDVSICLGTFRSISDDEWLLIANMVGTTFTGTVTTTPGNKKAAGHILGSPTVATTPVDIDEIRLMRLLKFTT